VESLRSINYNGQNSLNLKSKFKNLKLYPTCRGTKIGLKSLYENKQFSPPKNRTAGRRHLASGCYLSGTLSPVIRTWARRKNHRKDHTPLYLSGVFFISSQFNRFCLTLVNPSKTAEYLSRRKSPFLAKIDNSRP
jgi:hypothetical protein